MADSSVKKGEIISIPKVSSIAGHVSVHNDMGQTLWKRGGSLVVFLMALALPLSPLLLLVMLIQQPDVQTYHLSWLWITMGVITEPIAILTAYGLVRFVAEGE